MRATFGNVTVVGSAAGLRPAVAICDGITQVLVEQTTAVDPSRLGPLVGHVSRTELDAVEALRMTLQLD